MNPPFNWFGGKSRAGAEVSAAIGDVPCYIEPFAGSLGVLLGRAPVAHEVVNDLDGMIVNFWRAVRANPEAVAWWADQPVTELDLVARHLHLVRGKEALRDRLEADPAFYDAMVAGWWVWGICAWLGSGWCSGSGPWRLGEGGERVVKGGSGPGVNKQAPASWYGPVHGVRMAQHGAVLAEMAAFAVRLRHVRVLCGDWKRAVTPAMARLGSTKRSVCGVLLDPPYPAGWDPDATYAGQSASAESVYAEATAWAAEAGDNPRWRIVVCGYDGLWTPPPGWTTRTWKNLAGHKRAKGQRQEVLWCSPGCVSPDVSK